MSNYMTSQPRKQTVTTHILPKILRSKDSLSYITKFGQLIEYNVRKNVFKKLCRK